MSEIKSFKQITESYAELLEVMLKKKKVWKPDEKGNLKKVIKKECHDANGRAEGFKVVGKKCEKMSPGEVKTKEKAMKKAQKTKIKNAGKIERRAEKIMKKKIAKGLVQPKEITDDK